MNEKKKHWWNDTDRGELKFSDGRKPVPGPIRSSQNPHQFGLGLNPWATLQKAGI
jgi:hypothetical protein